MFNRVDPIPRRNLHQGRQGCFVSRLEQSFRDTWIFLFVTQIVVEEDVAVQDQERLAAEPTEAFPFTFAMYEKIYPGAGCVNSALLRLLDLIEKQDVSYL